MRRTVSTTGREARCRFTGPVVGLEFDVNAVQTALRGTVLLALTSTLTGCVVLPVERPYPVRAHVVVPLRAEPPPSRWHDDRRWRRERRDRYDDDSGPRRW